MAPPLYLSRLIVRTCDMKVVQNFEVNEGYCALPYSWSRPGDVMKNETIGKADVDDQGKHKIVFPAKIVRKSREVENELHAKSSMSHLKVLYKRYARILISSIFGMIECASTK